MLARLVWRIYIKVRDVRALRPVINIVGQLTRNLLFPRGIEAGLWGKSKSRLPAHFPKVARRHDQVLAKQIRQLCKKFVNAGGPESAQSHPVLSPIQKNPSFSVVINTLNRAEHLKTALRALEQQAYTNFEVVVVVGPCTDHTLDVLASISDHVRVVHCDVANLSVSRNIGISAAAGEIIAFLDDDAIPEPQWLSHFAKSYVVTGPETKNFAALGGAVRDHTGVTFQCRGIAINRLAVQRNLDDQDALVFDSLDQHLEAISTTGCNSTFRRDALISIGGFDETFVYFLDESDVNVRLKNAGYQQSYCFAAEVHHKYAASALRQHNRIPTSLYQVARSLSYFAVKHGARTFDPAKIIKRLEDFRHEERQMLAGYMEMGLLQTSDGARMVDEIEKGMREGVEAAVEQLDTSLNPSLSRIQPSMSYAFRPYKIKRPPEARLKIVLISQEDPSVGTNGIAVWTWQLAVGLAERGHEVTIIARAAKDFATVDFVSGIWIHKVVTDRANPLDHLSSSQLPQWHASHARAVSDEVSRVHVLRGIDLVMGPIWDLETYYLKDEKRYPVCISLHTTYKLAEAYKPDWCNNRQFQTENFEKIVSGEALLLRNARYLLANSGAIVESLSEAYGLPELQKRAHLIPHGADDWSTKDSVKMEKRPDKLRIVYFGRLEQRKGADLFLETALGLLETRQDVEVIMIGNGSIPLFEDGRTFEQVVNERSLGVTQHENFVWTGQVPKCELIGWVKSADIVVLPSRYESFGLVYAEASSLSKAIVALDVPASREVLGDAAILVGQPTMTNSELVIALRAAIEELLSSPTRRTELSVAARARYLKYYMPDTMIQAFEDFAREVVSEWKAEFVSSS